MDNPQIIIRMGSHAEKEYILKLGKKFDGIIVGGNMVEATAGATSSLLGRKLNIPYYIDPMTYVFGCDLEGIKAERTIEKKKQNVIKGSYQKLASELGEVFKKALVNDAALQPSDFSDDVVNKVCQNVVNFQCDRLRREFMKDKEYKEYAESIASPKAVFAPYFFIDSDEWFDLFFKLSISTAILKQDTPVHSVLCTTQNKLLETDFINRVVEDLPKTGVKGIWLWFSKFDEWEAQETHLSAFKNLVKRLSEEGLEVYNRHGGYFSLALNKFGMTGISHAVGYGEKKDAEQTKGAPNAPIVRYYLPDMCKRYGVPEIEYCFDGLGIKTPDDFYREICNCIICKGVIKVSIRI